MTTLQGWAIVIGMAVSMVGVGVFFGTINTKMDVVIGQLDKLENTTNSKLESLETRTRVQILDLETRVRVLERWHSQNDPVSRK